VGTYGSCGPDRVLSPSFAWLSLGEGDNDPNRFLAYLVAALQTVVPNLGEGVLAALQSPQPPPIESILTALLNEITAIPEDCVLICHACVLAAK
jgi:LuxR family maltose regulon positive regulatory protein